MSRPTSNESLNTIGVVFNNDHRARKAWRQNISIHTASSPNVLTTGAFENNYLAAPTKVNTIGPGQTLTLFSGRRPQICIEGFVRDFSEKFWRPGLLVLTSVRVSDM